MKKQNQSQISSLQTFQKFFINIQECYLQGFHTNITQKIKGNIESLGFVAAKNIFLKLCQKDIKRHKKNWKQQQVNLFLYVVDKACLKFSTDFFNLIDQQWSIVAQLIPGRDSQSCKTKMISLVPTNLNTTPWTEQEQQILAEIIQRQGTKKWKTVSLKLYERSSAKIYRSSKQCRQRYMCFLKPDLKKGFWSDSQDYQLILLFLKYGRKWSKMTQFINGRNQNAIKNRFFLLFQQSSRNQKLYYSQFIRKVTRRKQKLQKILGISTHATTSKQTKPQDQQIIVLEINNQICIQNQKQHQKQKIIKENMQIFKSDSHSTQKQYKSQELVELVEIQKFFTF